ncbi:MAG: asparagine synthase (glutamine-hydrolyzing) [Gemmataceae bacterium]
MCGIAGVIDLAGRRRAPAGVLSSMARALLHRGPDDDGFYETDGVGFSHRRLSIIGLADGKQPIGNEDRTVEVVFNGELFDYIEKREDLKAQGHRFRTSTDTEILPHLWEQYGPQFFEHIRGQFAFALYDSRTREVVLARDRIGILPLFYAFKRDAGGEWLLFASEIKGLLASGMIDAKPDPLGLNGVFTHFAVPGPRTCFAGINSLPPGQFVHFRLGEDARSERIQHKAYWNFDFPDRGHEVDGPDDKIIGRYEDLLMKAVQRRLRADVPVVSYLSGGVDSSQVVAMAVKALGRALPTYTIGVQSKGLNEENEAAIVARHVGCSQNVVPFAGVDVNEGYPELIATAEMPVIDTACAAMLALARTVHSDGYKVALTGEGSDEFLAGYPWFKTDRLFSVLNIIPQLPVAMMAKRIFARLHGIPLWPWKTVKRNAAASGGYGPWLEPYGMMSTARLFFFSEEMQAAVGDHVAYEDLQLDLRRMAKWHPLNRGLALGIRVMLPGMLLQSKGDRVAMHSSVETRYPFLDEDLIAYSNSLHPRWRLRGFKDKYILRQVAKKWLPESIAGRKKVMFRAPMDCFHLDHAPGFVDQLLSEESLKKTGYFDPASVKHWRDRLSALKPGPLRTAIEMGLVAVTSTQLWHQIFIDSSIANVPSGVGSRESGVGKKGTGHASRHPTPDSRLPAAHT